MGWKNWIKSFCVLIIGGIIAGLAITLPFFVNPSNDESINWARSRTALSAITIPIVVFGFYYTTIQFRKTMAKPKIKVAFSDKGEQKANLAYTNNNTGNLPDLWLINEGNAISRYFQVDLIIPIDIFIRAYTTKFHSTSNKDRNIILSYVNDGRYTLFVNNPHKDVNMIFPAAINNKKCIEIFRDRFEIEYKIFGDWAETQEGRLKIDLIKLKETKDEPASG